MQCPYCKEEIIDGATKCKHCNSVIGGPAAQSAAQPAASAGGDFGERFTAAMELWKANLGDLAVLTLVFLLVMWIPFANIGFATGYFRAILKVSRGQGKAAVGDLFNAWDCFANLLVYVILLVIVSLVLHIVPILGQLAAMALGFAAMPGFFLIVDKNKSPVDAFKWSLATIQADFVNWLLTYIVASVISMAGLLLLLIGFVLTGPLGSLLQAQQYDRNKPA